MIDNLLPMAVEFAEKHVWMVILTLSQAVLIAFKIIEGQRKKKGNNPHPCARHGERLAAIEARIGNLEKQVDRLINGKG